MIDHDNGRLRAVAWLELCPWLNIFRAFRPAIGLRSLLLSAVAVFLTIVGWSLLIPFFSGNAELVEQVQQIAPGQVAPGQVASGEHCPWLSIIAIVPDKPGWPSDLKMNPISHVWKQLSLPFQNMFDEGVTLTGTVYWLLCGLWALAVWALFGGAITRNAAVQLAAEERISWGSMISHTQSHWRAYFAAPLFPLLGVVLATLPIIVLGLLLKTGPSLWIAALLWPLALVGGAVMAVLLLGLLFGWPLMWTTISTEGTDSFDALSRSYAYVFQRPLHYLFYVVVAGVFGLLGWLLVSNFAAAVIQLTYWAASWGSGRETIEAVMQGGESLGAVGGAGAVLIRFWVGCVKLLAVGFLYSYFWNASTAIYLLLRRDVDATEMDEVFIEDDEESYDLPPLKTDEAGAPVVDDEPPTGEYTPDDADDKSSQGEP